MQEKETSAERQRRTVDLFLAQQNKLKPVRDAESGSKVQQQHTHTHMGILLPGTTIPTYSPTKGTPRNDTNTGCFSLSFPSAVSPT